MSTATRHVNIAGYGMIRRVTTIHEGREYRVATPIGDYDVWTFGPHGVWFVADSGDTDACWHGPSLDGALAAINEVAAELA